MTSVAYDEDTKDLKFINGDLVLINGSEEVEHLLRANLRTFLGEWFLDTRVGVPWHEEVFVKNPNLARVDATLKQVILETSGVLELQSFVIGYSEAKRQLEIDFAVKSEQGEIIINEVF
jgi:hypothetical protein